MSVYLLIGLTLGFCRALVEVVDYLVGWYQVRHIVHTEASLHEFAWLAFYALIFAPLLMAVFWPFWFWTKFSEYRAASK